MLFVYPKTPKPQNPKTPLINVNFSVGGFIITDIVIFQPLLIKLVICVASRKMLVLSSDISPLQIKLAAISAIAAEIGLKATPLLLLGWLFEL